jgi:hypothetical protein
MHTRTYLFVLGLGVSMYNIYKKYVHKYLCIYPLSRIYNTSLISAYFGLDSRECKCLEYLFKINNKRISTLAPIIYPKLSIFKNLFYGY